MALIAQKTHDQFTKNRPRSTCLRKPIKGEKALERETRMQEQMKQQHIPVKVYRTAERLMIAAPMPGLEPENMLVEVTHDGRLILHGDQRAMLKEVKELLVDEWSVGVYHRELALPVPVNAVCANVTYGNGVLLV